MTLDPALWAALEDHGVTVAHLEMLARALKTHRNGSVTWHFAHGRLTQCDLRIVCPSRRDDVARVTEAVLGDAHRLLR